MLGGNDLISPNIFLFEECTIISPLVFLFEEYFVSELKSIRQLLLRAVLH